METKIFLAPQPSPQYVNFSGDLDIWQKFRFSNGKSGGNSRVSLSSISQRFKQE